MVKFSKANKKRKIWQPSPRYLTNNPSQTKKLGKILAEEILKTSPTKKSLISGLEGDLGSGKTTFLQGFAKGLRIKEKILSPSFVIMKKFEIPTKDKARQRRLNLKSKYINFYHIDCYRLQKSKEILDLGFKEIIQNPKNIVVVEWADKISDIMPKNTIWLKFKFIDKNKRKIMVR